jgi:hypothetical protein
MDDKRTGEDAVVVLAADSELRVSVAAVDYNDGILCEDRQGKKQNSLEWKGLKDSPLLINENSPALTAAACAWCHC